METGDRTVLPMGQAGLVVQTVPLHSHPIVHQAAGGLHQHVHLHQIVRLEEADSPGPTVQLQRIVHPAGQTGHHQIMEVHLAEPEVAAVEDIQVVAEEDLEVVVVVAAEEDDNSIHSAA